MPDEAQETSSCSAINTRNEERMLKVLDIVTEMNKNWLALRYQVMDLMHHTDMTRKTHQMSVEKTVMMADEIHSLREEVSAEFRRVADRLAQITEFLKWMTKNQ